MCSSGRARARPNCLGFLGLAHVAEDMEVQPHVKLRTSPTKNEKGRPRPGTPSLSLRDLNQMQVSVTPTSQVPLAHWLFAVHAAPRMSFVSQVLATLLQ